jgi:hypothetical protein
MNEPLYTLPSRVIPQLDMKLVNNSTTSAAADDNRSQYSAPTHIYSVRSNAPFDEVENKSGSDITARMSHKSILEQWNRVENLRTLFGWITISALNIECLNEAIIRYRKFIAYGTIMGLLFSTASGTISATQFNTHNTKINFSLNVLFTFFSFMIAVYTGILKTLQIQERLENFIKIKQEWILFSATISSELQLPIHLRTPILSIIKNYKNKFLDLLKTDLEIPDFIKKDIIHQIKVKEEQKYKNKKWDDLKYSESSSLSDVIMEIGSQELKRLLTQDSSRGEMVDAVKKYKKTIGSGDCGKKSAAASGVSRGGVITLKEAVTTERDAIKRDLDNIYRQFALIHKNVESMNSSISNKREKTKNKKHNVSRRKIIESEDDEETGGSGNSSERNLSRHFSFNDIYDKNIFVKMEKLREDQKKLDNMRKSITNSITTISDVYKNILDGSIAQQILQAEEIDIIPESRSVICSRQSSIAGTESDAGVAAAAAPMEEHANESDDESKSGGYISSICSYNSKV